MNKLTEEIVDCCLHDDSVGNALLYRYDNWSETVQQALRDRHERQVSCRAITNVRKQVLVTYLRKQIDFEADHEHH